MPLYKRHRLRRDALAPAGEAEPLRGGASHSHPVGLHTHRLRQPSPHLLPVRSDARLLTDDNRIDVRDLPSGSADQDSDRSQEAQAVRAFE